VDGKVTVVGHTTVRTVKRNLEMLRDKIKNPICILNFNVYKIDSYTFSITRIKELHVYHQIIIGSNIQFLILYLSICLFATWNTTKNKKNTYKTVM